MAIAFRDAGRRVRILAEPGVPEAWARDLWRTAMAAAPQVFLTMPLPRGAEPCEVFVKVYHRRPRLFPPAAPAGGGGAVRGLRQGLPPPPAPQLAPAARPEPRRARGRRV